MPDVEDKSSPESSDFAESADSQSSPASGPAKKAAGSEQIDQLAELAREHPGLVFAGGLALGLLAGALVPKGAASKIASRTVALASAAGELGLALSRQAREGAESLVHDSVPALEDNSAAVQQGNSGQQDRTWKVGRRLAHEALKLAIRRKN